MSTDSTTTTNLHYAQQRHDGADSTRFATIRANLNGKATAADRAAHQLAALVVAGLVGDVTPIPVPGQYKATADGTLVMGADGAPTIDHQRWTPARLEILADLLAGYSYNQMAARQNRNVETVKKHCGNLYRLFGVGTRVECVIEAVRCGLLPAPADPRTPDPAPAPRARRSRPTAQQRRDAAAAAAAAEDAPAD